MHVVKMWLKPKSYRVVNKHRFPFLKLSGNLRKVGEGFVISICLTFPLVSFSSMRMYLAAGNVMLMSYKTFYVTKEIGGV